MEGGMHMARTLQEEKERLLKNGADPKILEYETVNILLLDLIRNARYGEKAPSGALEEIEVNDDGTFDLRTETINGYVMEKTPMGNLQLTFVERQAAIYATEWFGGVKRRKVKKDAIVINSDGKVIDQTFYSTKKHGFLP